jgi:hypothetical protein
MTSTPLNTKTALSILCGALAVGAVFMGIFGYSANRAESSPLDNLSGYAWSDSIGWISMNCTDPATCGASNYGVTVAPAGDISGYAWSDNIGWVSFNAADVAGCPSAPCAPRMDKGTGIVTGWAKALIGGTPNAGGWDGFISLSGANYGVTVAGCAWNGFAWGSMVVGWVNFGGNGGTVTGVGDACMAPLLDPNLISEAIVVPALVKANTPTPLSAKVKNASPIDTNISFDDNFTYRWNNAGNWNAFAGNVVTHGAGIAGNATLNDNANITTPGTGDLYIQHCVDTNNTIAEGPNEIPNCTESTPIRVIDGDLIPSTVNPNVGDVVTFTWNTQNTAGLNCRVEGSNGDVWVGLNKGAPGEASSPIGAGLTTYDLSCTNGAQTVLIERVTLSADIDPTLTATPRIVKTSGDNTKLTWDLQGQVNCTLTGGSINQAVNANGFQNTPVTGRTIYTLTCPLGAPAKVSVEVQPRGFEE